MYLQLILTLSCFSHVFSVPVSTSSNCTPSCQWTQWFNVDRPTNKSDGGDLETLDNIRAHGYNICRAPKDINCRSVRFPYIPYTYLLYKSQCDRSTGLICLNRDNVDPCIDFEVQLLCCTCEEEPPKTTVLPVVTTMSTSSNCTPSCQWTQWFNVDRPTNKSDGGDLETLDNIRAHGYNICRAPKDINCRSVRFPYIPYTHLLYKSQCDRSTGLICLNRDNVDPCIDFEVQLLCCTCEEEPPKTTVLPVVTTMSTSSNCTPSCQWTQWFNVDRPTNKSDGGDLETLDNIRAHGYNICRAPKDINCRSVRFPYIPYTYLLYKSQCDRSTGLICLNRDNVDPCIDFEVQLLCCTCEEETPKTTVLPVVTTKTPATQCENPRCSWTQWFNTQNPTSGPDGGEFENITTIRKQGYSVCDFPKAIQCRLGRFPYIPLNMLYYVQECSVFHGLVCLNKNQQGEKCLDYEVQFKCCACDTSTPMQSLIIPEDTTNLMTLVTSKHSAQETPNATEVLFTTTNDMFFEVGDSSGIPPNNN